MCCFSGTVRHVSGTNIFARHADHERQFLVYQMTYDADRPLAMILPLPVKIASGETAVRFINLKAYDTLFDDLALSFLPPPSRSQDMAIPATGAAGGSMLRVYTVGDFVASFVPRMRDFHRLDPRFVIPQTTWQKIPSYRDWGFAVFQLRRTDNPSHVHPMALEFDSRFTKSLFFPTVHIHDGSVHDREHFDHYLYFQRGNLPFANNGFLGFNRQTSSGVETSKQSLRDILKTEHLQNIVDVQQPCYRRTMQGVFANKDIFLKAV